MSTRGSQEKKALTSDAWHDTISDNDAESEGWDNDDQMETESSLPATSRKDAMNDHQILMELGYKEVCSFMTKTLKLT